MQLEQIKKSLEVSSCPSHCETIYSNDSYDDGDDDTPQPTGGAANDSRNIVNDGSANMAANNDNGDDDDNNDGDGGDDGGDNENDNRDVDFDGCQKCFCNPCVTQNRQSWLGNAVAHTIKMLNWEKALQTILVNVDRRQA